MSVSISNWFHSSGYNHLKSLLLWKRELPPSSPSSDVGEGSHPPTPRDVSRSSTSRRSATPELYSASVNWMRNNQRAGFGHQMRTASPSYMQNRLQGTTSKHSLEHQRYDDTRSLRKKSNVPPAPPPASQVRVADWLEKNIAPPPGARPTQYRQHVPAVLVPSAGHYRNTPSPASVRSSFTSATTSAADHMADSHDDDSIYDIELMSSKRHRRSTFTTSVSGR